ncbi:MAG: response regulator [Proteobacteria bacterium]|nr:response regulator [Pseudomonadota bacterium]MBU1717096.1 response regulator [Pseudomonadota bacterium]
MAEKMKKILIVDDEEDMIWSLKNNLNHEKLQVDILTASSGEEALEILKNTPVDLIITDIKMSGISGLELLIEVKNRYQQTGVIVMTAYPSPEFKSEALSKGSLHFIEKPFDINNLRKVVRHALREDNLFKGTVAGVELSDIIQINCLSRTTTALKVKTSNQEGIIYFLEGKIVHAVCGDLHGDDAFFKILAFNGGTLESMKITEAPNNTIKSSFEALLIEGARRMDEKNSSEENDSFNPDALEIKNAPSTTSGKKNNKNKEAAKENLKTDNIDKEAIMNSLQDLLTEFTNIPGVNTACLVGRDGFLLDSIALSGIDTEMIGAIASSGFGASESMGNQLGKGAMSMTMIEYANGPVMFSPIGNDAFLVIVADKESNLGMIRLKIKKHASAIATTAAI